MKMQGSEVGFRECLCWETVRIGGQVVCCFKLLAEWSGKASGSLCIMRSTSIPKKKDGPRRKESTEDVGI